MGDDLDRALEVLAGTSPSYGGGFANHGPMVVETLDFLGRFDAIASWVAWYAPRLEPLATAGQRYTEAVARFAAAIERDGWERAAASAIPALLDDAAAGSAGHGLLRVAHAVRALNAAPTAARRHELAHALAAWEGSFRLLPGNPPAPRGTLSAADALAAVPHPSIRAGGFFTDVLPAVAVAPGFADAVNALAVPADLTAGISELTAAAARAYLANSARAAIALVHAVTIPAAYRTLLPLLDEADARRGFAAVWQAVAAMVAGFGRGLVAETPRADATDGPPRWSEVIAAAVEARDDHAIKLAGACWAEDAIAPAPGFIGAAHDAALRLDVRQRSA